MFAEVIVNHRSRAVDRTFDYCIPAELEDRVRVGSRVIIPFSKGNMEKEGFVMRIKSETDAVTGIKSIIDLSTDEPAFKENMVPVIEFMHEKYLALYLDIIHTIIPTGTAVKSLEWITAKDNSVKLSNETDKKILELINDNGGGMEFCSLQSYFDKSIKQRISLLEKKGVIVREFKHTTDVHEKTMRAVRLAVDEEKADEYRKGIRSVIQKRMIGVLLNNEIILAADIVRFTSGNYQALKTLIDKGIAEFYDLKCERRVFECEECTDAPPILTHEQDKAVTEICKSVDMQNGDAFLLHGVTGSGKTEVYLHAISHCIETGKTALMLVPEISLTPQMVSRFVRRFGKRIAILHSGLSLGERYDQWCRILRNEADIVIGARSAVFAPIDNIGVIIVDEEHSDTYKSEMNPRYHARETALFRAGITGAVTLLASATPSVESYYYAEEGRYKLLEMKTRYNENNMPQIEIVDMRSELENGNKSIFSKQLYDAIKENLDNGRQTILFMNRRGYSTFVSCRKCGFVPQCPNCNITLTYHRYDNSLKCHYCGHKEPNYKECPMCKSQYIRYFGGGTQKVEEEVLRIFPNATTLRLDADVTGRKNAHKEILDKFVKEKIDILIGTQMVAKGLDFPDVTLVGVITADTMLHINDFRSGERTFDTLEQVSGRAGRGIISGKAVIQTYEPDNYAVKLVKDHDYTTFYRKTLSERRLMWYPPFSEMICIVISGTHENEVKKASSFFKESFGNINEINQKIAVLGPIPSGISRIKNKYRWQIIIKCEDADALNKRISRACKAVSADKSFAGIAVAVDKNPITIY